MIINIKKTKENQCAQCLHDTIWILDIFKNNGHYELVIDRGLIGPREAKKKLRELNFFVAS